MFSVDCPRHGARVLLGPDAIVAVVAHPGGIAVRWRCTCGQTGVWTTGRSEPWRGRLSAA
ncbi:MAG: hypothetical protein M3N68_09225 [Actinomycetota bacterium]|nr:hypothetical protein [Actinomycetota bacterium]